MPVVQPVAIITGASRGVGKSILRKLSKEGLSCIAIASSKGSIERISRGDHFEFVHNKQRHRSLAIDLSKWPEWTMQDKHYGIEHNQVKGGYFGLFDIWKDEGTVYRPNILVNCAGITQETLSLRTPPETISRIMNVNFMSAVTLTNLTIKQMIKSRKHSCAEPPCIINISSILGTPDATIPGTSIYSSSKAALSKFTEVLAQEMNPWNIKVTSMSPGLVPGTDMVKNLQKRSQEALQELSESYPTTSSEDIATQIWDIYSS